MRFDEWVCNECKIYWDRELPIGTAPKRTKCPKCTKLSQRYWQNQGVNVKWGNDTDFHTVRARHEKKNRLGWDKTEGDRFLHKSIEVSENSMNNEDFRYRSANIDYDKFASSRGLKKCSQAEVEQKVKNAKELTSEAYNKANSMGYRDIGSEKLDIAKPNKNTPT